MNARICANPKCRSIMPAYTCGLCNTPTEPLPRISLSLIGVDATARLTHTSLHGFSILVTAPSGSYNINLSIPDLLRSAQAHLPYLNETTGLMIMDSLKTAAAFMRTKNTGHWAGWVLYLLEQLQDHAHTDAFHEFLKELQQDILTTVLQGEDAQGEA